MDPRENPEYRAWRQRAADAAWANGVIPGERPVSTKPETDIDRFLAAEAARIAARKADEK